MSIEKDKTRVTGTGLVCDSLEKNVTIRPVEMASIPPRSVPFMFEQTCRKYPGRSALNYFESYRWNSISYREYFRMVKICAKGFLKLGLKPRKVVCIMGSNSPEWFISDLGAIYAGGVAAGIYATNSPESSLYCLNHSEAVIMVAEYDQIGKIQKVRNQANYLKALIQYGREEKVDGVILWKEFLRIGESEDDSALKEAKASIAVNQCCTLVYTSGTTGNPKAAMLSHDNVVYDAIKIGERLKLSPGKLEKYVSYLPLSHVAGNVVDIHCCFIFAVKVFFADKDALKGTLVNTLTQVKPTRFLSVPRVWEKMFDKFQERAAHVKGIKKKLAKWAKKEGLRRNLAKEKNKPYLGCYPVAKAVVLKKVKRMIGLQHCKTIISGAAPLSREIKLYFASLDIIILEAFGMSESSALHCCCTSSKFNFNSCGTACKGMETMIADPDQDGNGELCLYGRHIFMGYMKDMEKTKETIDSIGFLKTGDVAKIDDRGFIYITGRMKEILITAGGENVAPTLIEQAIKAELPFLGYTVVIGDKKKFLIVLITLTCEVNDNQEPTDHLGGTVKLWLQKLGLSYTTIKEVLDSGPHPKIVESLQKGIDEANKRAISNAQKVQKFVILPRDFSVPTGELGPTMKVKRNVVSEKYEQLINKTYQDAIGK